MRLVARRGGATVADGRPGRPWRLTLPDRVLLVAMYWRTNLTMRQIGALGEPQPGNRNDTLVYRSSGINQQLAGREVMADGAYRGNPDVIIPYRKPRDGSELPAWKQDYNSGHRKIRARVEHALARLKTYKILRDYRRAGRTLAVTAAGIAHLHNIALAG